MSNVISFTDLRDIRNRINIHVDHEKCADIAATISLRPGPAETKSAFVARIVRAYLEGGK